MSKKNGGVAPGSGKTQCSSIGEYQNREVGKGRWENRGIPYTATLSLSRTRGHSSVLLGHHLMCGHFAAYRKHTSVSKTKTIVE